MADPADVEDEEAEEQAPKKNWRRDLEDRAKSAESERDTLKRELAFHRAGLTDLSDKQVRALAATHEGEMTPEALRATAEELGFSKPGSAETPQVAEQVEDHSAEAGRIARLAGSPASVSAPSDAKAAFYEKIENWKGPKGQRYDEFILANAHLMDE